jgi:prepilin peptidase CpaA
MNPPHFEVAVPLLAIVALATASDLRDRTIPNGLSLGGAAIGLFMNAALWGLPGFELAVLGWVFCLLCFLPFYVSGGMAAGDVKLMALVGAFVGPVHGLVACGCALCAGSALAFVAMLPHKIQHWRENRIVAAALPGFVSSAAAPLPAALDKVPYAAAIALGTTAAVLQPSWLMAALEGALK